MKDKTFWQHIEDLRWVLLRSLIVVCILTVVVFFFKDFVFNSVVLAPCKKDFISFHLFDKIVAIFSRSNPSTGKDIELININLSAQLFLHLSISFYLGLIAAAPYIITEIWLYIAPALYQNERKIFFNGVIFFIILFFIGVFVAYYFIFPITLNFLYTYQVSDIVPNTISLNSYISTFLSLILMMGIVFEMPVVAYFFAKIGLLKTKLLTKYRRVAIVIVFFLAALITPTTDIFTMLLVALPLQLLYEFSIIVVRRTEKKRNAN